MFPSIDDANENELERFPVRLAIVQVSQVHGFNDQSDHLQPVVLEKMVSIATQYGALVLSRHSNTLRIAFNIPDPLPLSSYLAIRCTVEMQQMIHQFENASLSLCVGIDQGEVLLDKADGDDAGYRVVGNVVDIAGYLAELALPDEIVVSDRMYIEVQPLPKGLVAIAAQTTTVPGGNEEQLLHHLQSSIDETQPLMKLSSVISSPTSAVQVVVAEDNPGLRSAFVKVLKNAGLEVAVAINGHEVLQHLKDNNPQVLLLDVGLPGISGLEVVQFVRSQSPASLTKIVLVTGNHVAAASPEAEMADLVLIKPVSTRDLVNFVKRFIK